MSENQQANEVGGLVRRPMLETMVVMSKLRSKRGSATLVASLKDGASPRLKVLDTAEDLMALFGCQQ